MKVQYETGAKLLNIKHVAHGFFTKNVKERNNFNCAFAFGEKQEVLLNRKLAANMLGLREIKIASLKQIHSNKVIIVDKFSDLSSIKEGDGLVSKDKNIALAILTADCAPILFADKERAIIGAAHAGWKGAVSGIMQNIIKAMHNIGAKKNNIIVTIGPTICAKHYEIGPLRAEEILAANPRTKPFIFIPPNKKREYFDLPAFIKSELEHIGILQVENINLCTYANPDRFFSHRFSTHFPANEGRQISLICLK